MSRRSSVRPGYRRLSVVLPEGLVSEVYAAAGRNVSKWVEEALRERLEQERSRQLLKVLPLALREKAVKAAGSEQAAPQFVLKLLEQSLTDLEEEEEVQETLGELHRRELRKV